LKYFLVKQDGRERDVTKSVNANRGLQRFYHSFLNAIAKNNDPERGFYYKFIDTAMKNSLLITQQGLKLYKETEHGREFIYNIP